MRIAIDLSSLQGPHRMRGIGYTLINLVSNISADARKDHYFVFFISGEKKLNSEGSVLSLLDLDGMNYEVRQLSPDGRSRSKLRGKLQLFVGAYNHLMEMRDIIAGDRRYGRVNDIDVFLQTDQMQGLPRKRGMTNALVVYDIIPYVLEWDYMWSYRTARIRGYSRKAALRTHVSRKIYAHKLRAKSRRADILLSISECTKKDFVEKLGVKAEKVLVTPLGVNIPKVQHRAPNLMRYEATSWGYSPRPYELKPEAPFLLFVGGADPRRRLKDLVTAFNHLRGEGHELKLVLAGDSMQGPLNISTLETQQALIDSSYLDDIIFLGFINDEQRDWLYANSLAFVFPSKYEGFGLPVLEALAHRSPVIAYENSAVREVAEDIPMYAQDYKSLMSAITDLINSPDKQLRHIKDVGYKHAIKYNWRATSDKVIAAITQTSK